MERLSYKAQHWIGTPQSLVLHTLLFAGFFISVLLGVDFSKMLLVLTTIVSLEAIYLSIFIQMGVNKYGSRLKEVAEDVDDVLEDTKELTEEEDNMAG